MHKTSIFHQLEHLNNKIFIDKYARCEIVELRRVTRVIQSFDLFFE